MGIKEKRRIVVTGMGVMCGAGNSVDEFLSCLRSGKTGITINTLFDTTNLTSKYAGQIKNVNLPVNIDKSTSMSRSELIMEHILEEALISSGLHKEYIGNLEERCQVSIASSVGINEHLMDYVSTIREGGASNGLLSMYTNLVRAIKRKCSITGAFNLNTAACTAGTAAIGHAITQIRSNKADMVVVIGIDTLTDFSSDGFNSLKNTSHTICKPFDKKRDGITIGEGGGVLILEEYEHAIQRKANMYCEMYGYGIGNDAYHITSPDVTGQGAYNTMSMAINDAGISKNHIDYINAHGTGTELNDQMENTAIEEMFGEVNNNIYVNSTKSTIGHCLAAAGMIEMIATILTIMNEEIYPSIFLEEPISEKEHIKYVRKEIKKYTVRYAISNSYAFAGNSASVIVGKINEHINVK